ncbi:hypothetical protein TL16_g04012 [Triparma laevis f. inornata]|uniref:EF-hand domain-containing protein n=1 Tax=Triparma laevis f. inornata TaxID=1714386 RepID=A0A9W7A2G2_9STRA|nr:hypothetical protein TL16_g04012 [Triparma laevis f. inornata]
MPKQKQLLDVADVGSAGGQTSVAATVIPEDTFCIGDLEHDLHNTFAATRVPTSNYVYASHGVTEQALENYADNGSESMSGKTEPLVISGASGVGKSALLANWLIKHQAEVKRSRTITDEFVFWHVVGCSRQSTYTYLTLRRLMSELKEHFELTAAIPSNDEKLPWDLPRFLEMASKKGRLLIIIDGLHRLRAEEGELGLKWLPLSFPSNCRVIISTTSPGGEDDEDAGFDTGNAEDDAIGASEGKKERVLEELKRRNWKIVEVEPLPESTSEHIVESFLRLSSKIQAKKRKKVAADALAKTNTATFLTATDDNSMTSVEQDLDPHTEKALVLFPSIKEKILSDLGAKNPLFLRTLLHAAEYAGNHGYDLWSCIDKWMDGADGVNRLYDEILQTFENGQLPTRDDIELAKDRCKDDGGFAKLLDENPWNPSLLAMSGAEMIKKQAKKNAPRPKEENTVKHADDDEVVQDRLMKEANAVADEKLVILADDSSNKLNSVVSDIQERVSAMAGGTSGSQFLAWLESSEGRKAIPGHTSGEPTTTPSESKEEETNEQKSESKDSDEDDDYGDEDYEEDDDYEDEFEDEDLDLGVPSRTTTPAAEAKRENKTLTLSLSHSSSKLPSFAEEKARRDEEARLASEAKAARSPGKRRSQSTGGGSLDMSGYSEDADEFENIPIYLKGGKKVKGLGPLLGYALALLYTSRHGLKESELFDLLIRIQDEDEWAQSMSGTEADAEMKIFKVFANHRLRLTDAFNQFDKDKNGLLTYDEFKAGINNLHPKVDVTEDQVNMLIRSLDKNHDGVIDYTEAMDRFEKDARDFSHGKKRLGPNNIDGDQSSLESGSMAEKKSIIADIDMDFLKDSTTPANTILEPRTLGDEVEEALLTALINLGVIYAPGLHNVLMLPLESEALREVVWWRYVGSAEGQAKWHAHIIAFFMEQRPSLRRCEELPWHLRKCRKWTALRNVLVDLRTFDIMYNGEQLKGELFNYWRALIQGPLYMSDEIEASIVLQSGNPREPELLAELSEASKNGLSDSQVRKKRLQGQMAPFDIVDEYNRAVEMWHAGLRPSTRRLEMMISNISEFMAWFSEKMNSVSEPPPFLRKTMNFEQLKDLGVEQKEVLNKLDLLNRQEKQAQGIDILDGGAGGVEEKKEERPIGALPYSPEKYNIGGPGLLKPHYYYFNRWIWIMFPWLALKNAAAYSEQMTQIEETGEGKKPERKGSLLSFDLGDGSVPESPSIALGKTTSKMSKASSKMDEAKRRKRFWDNKKVNPHETPTSHHKKKASMSRDQAMISAEAGRISAANRMFDKLAEENKLLGIAPREMPKPARMDLEPTSEKGANIPFSYSSVKSQKSGCRFPSVEKFHKIQCQEDEDAMDSAAKKAIERFGGQEQPQTLMELINLKQSEETPFSAAAGGDLGFLPAHSQTFPTTNDDALLAQAFARAGKMRKLYDDMKMESKVKAEKLENMVRTVAERERKDGLTYKNMMAGETVMEMLQQRLEQMDSAVRNAKFLGEFYIRVQEVLLSNPAKDKNHIDALEQQLQLARQQQADLLKRRNNLYAEKERIEKHDRPKYMQEIKKARAKKLKIEPQVDAKKQELAENKKKLEDVSGGAKSGLSLFRDTGNGRAESAQGSSRPMSSNAPPTITIGEPVKLLSPMHGMSKDLKKSALGGLAGLAGGLAAEAGDYKQVMMTAAMEKLNDLTGTTNGDDLVEKFHQTKRMNGSLNAQKKFYENKVQKLKEELGLLQSELDELQFAGEEAVADANSNTDVRKMDGLANEAEMTCNHNRKKLDRQAALIHLVVTGIQHLARITDEADAAVKLPVNKVHSHLLDDPNYDANLKLLMKTEDRLTSVLEALTLGSSKQLGDDRGLSIAEKQTEIADEIHRAKMKALGAAAKKYMPKSRGGALEDRTRPNPHAESAALSSPQAIRINMLSKLDDDYDKNTKQYTAKADRRADMDEDEILAAENDAGKDEIVKFITEALDTRESRMEQRKAHVLNESKKGNHKDMGLTMDTVLGEQEERLAKEGPAKLMNFKKGKKSPRSAIAVHDRGELKKMSRKITRQKEKELAREAAAKAKAEFDLMNA